MRLVSGPSGCPAQLRATSPRRQGPGCLGRRQLGGSRDRLPPECGATPGPGRPGLRSVWWLLPLGPGQCGGVPVPEPLRPWPCRWRTAPSRPSSPRTSAWSSIPAMPSCRPRAPSVTCLAVEACGPPRGEPVGWAEGCSGWGRGSGQRLAASEGAGCQTPGLAVLVGNVKAARRGPAPVAWTAEEAGPPGVTFSEAPRVLCPSDASVQAALGTAGRKD